MVFEQQRKIIIIIGIAAIVIVILAAVLSWFDYLPRFFGGKEIVIEEDVNLITSDEALNIAFPEARKWSEDAKAAQINAKGKVSLKSGKSASWVLRFSSESKNGKGYETAVENRAVVFAKEIVFYWKGADLPENGFIGETEALNRLRQINGYENVAIQSIELIPSADGKSWFYGIKTEKGTITLPAGK